MTLPSVPASFDRGTLPAPERAALWSALVVALAAMRDAGMVTGAVTLSELLPADLAWGSHGAEVAAWQRIVGAKVDSSYEAETAAKTRAWAVSHGFGLRDRVTPAMWAVALGVTVATAGVDPMKLAIEIAAALPQ